MRKIEKVETAIEPRFQAHFVGAMAIPHKSDAFPHLEAALGVTFKRGGSGEDGGGRGGRERRRARAHRRSESMKFASDNWAGASPRVREAIVRRAEGFAKAYGLDETTAALADAARPALRARGRGLPRADRDGGQCAVARRALPALWLDPRP